MRDRRGGRIDHMSMCMLVCIQKDDGNENSQIAGPDDTRLPGLAAQRGEQGGSAWEN